MSDPVLLTASYQNKHFSTAYGSVVWSALENPPESGVDAYDAVTAIAQDKGSVSPSSRPNYINVSRHGDWLRDFYDTASIVVESES